MAHLAGAAVAAEGGGALRDAGEGLVNDALWRADQKAHRAESGEVQKQFGDTLFDPNMGFPAFIPRSSL